MRRMRREEGHTTIQCLEVSIDSKGVRLFGLSSHNTGLLVLSNTLLKEVGLSLKRNHLHPFEGVGGIVDLLVAESNNKTISDELDVLAHHLLVHTDERDGERVAHELTLNVDSLPDDLLNSLLRQLVVEHGVEKTGKVAMETLITRDELIGESKTRHLAALLEPENGTETSREEDTLNGGEGDDAVGKALSGLDPFESPSSLLCDTGNGLEGVEKVGLLFGVLDVGVNEETVSLRVNVLHGELEAIEAAGLGNLDLGEEALGKVLKNDTVTGGKEGEHILDEVLLVVVQTLPVLGVLGKVNLLGGPEAGFVLLVHLPDLVILDGEENKALLVLLEEGFSDFLVVGRHDDLLGLRFSKN